MWWVGYALDCHQNTNEEKEEISLAFTLCILMRFPQLSRYCFKSLSWEKQDSKVQRCEHSLGSYTASQLNSLEAIAECKRS